jgi:hypothetical protein
MKINSKPLISELKNFVATGVTFKAKLDEQDDLVSACLLIIRMSQILADWDSRVFDNFSSNESISEEEFELPMPIFISSSIG